MDLAVPPAEAAEIERHIASDASPVGIDAKATHVLILHQLLRLQKRLDEVEAELRALRSER